MNRKQQERFLKNQGFHFARDVRHGSLWWDGHAHILLARSGSSSSQNFRNWLAEVRRVVKSRPPELALRRKETVVQQQQLVKDDARPPAHKPTMEALAIAQKPTPEVKPVKQETPIKRLETRKANPELWGRIKLLRTEGRRAFEIAQQLTGEGWRSSSGAPIRESYVHTVMARQKKNNEDQAHLRPFRLLVHVPQIAGHRGGASHRPHPH